MTCRTAASSAGRSWALAGMLAIDRQVALMENRRRCMEIALAGEPRIRATRSDQLGTSDPGQGYHGGLARAPGGARTIRSRAPPSRRLGTRVISLRQSDRGPRWTDEGRC